MIQYSIIVGVGVDKAGRTIPAYVAEQEISFFADDLSRKFGGCSVIRQSGYWIDDKQELVHEPSVRFDVLVSTPKASKKGIRLAAEHVKQRFNQSAVIVASSAVNVAFV